MDNDPVFIYAEQIAARHQKRILSPKEVAEELYSRTDRSAAQMVRERLEKGVLIKGLRKQGGRWEIPVYALAKALMSPPPVEPTTVEPEFTAPVYLDARLSGRSDLGSHRRPGSRSGKNYRAPIGKRAGIYEFHQRLEKNALAIGEVWKHYERIKEIEDFKKKKELEAFLSERIPTNTDNEVKRERF